MRTIHLSSDMPSVVELLEMARTGTLLVETQDGDFFVINTVDSFDTEVELLRRNHTFLTMLDKFKSEKETIPLEQVEKDLR